jgi:hypothetical protein
VVIDTFSINDISLVVLFDSGASHSFISAAYVEKHNLPIALLRCQMIVSSPGGDMPARQLCPNVNLKIRGVDFVANLIVLESKQTGRSGFHVSESNLSGYFHHIRLGLSDSLKGQCPANRL